MAINSTIITQQDIDDAKSAIKTLRQLQQEVKTAVKAGLTPSTTEAELEDKISRLKLFIKGYTGEDFKG